MSEMNGGQLRHALKQVHMKENMQEEIIMNVRTQMADGTHRLPILLPGYQCACKLLNGHLRVPESEPLYVPAVISITASNQRISGKIFGHGCSSQGHLPARLMPDKKHRASDRCGKRQRFRPLLQYKSGLLSVRCRKNFPIPE